ncbi:hypothetical protein BH23GEM5_BH23GEM5_26800 [soil metagenome]
MADAPRERPAFCSSRLARVQDKVNTRNGDTMSPPHPFGHHFLIGLEPSTRLTEHDRRILEALSPAGVIFFTGSFAPEAPYEQWLELYRQLLADVRSAIGRERIIVSIDHEGGRVYRPPPPMTSFAYAREWPGQAEAVGRAMGIELRSLGVNVNFAPVVDVDSNPDNPVIGPRSFGKTPEQVIEAAIPFIRALEAEGVAGCPKHFPCHGDTSVDSHRELPVVDREFEELERIELAPFRAAVEAGVRLVMTAHVLFPAVDPEEPATLSHAITTGLLRERLGFEGVVVTDDIGMHAVSDVFQRGGAAADCIRAGVDLIDICAFGLDTELALELADEIARAQQSGALGDELLAESRARIEKLLAELPQHPIERLEPELFERHARLAPLHDPSGQGTGTWQP